MIIFRYFAKEVYSSVFAITLVLVLIFLVNQSIRFLTQAATGHIAASAVLDLIGLEMPYLLGLLLPLGLYLGVLITYSRFYADQEMTVLFSAGMSEWRLLQITTSIASVIFLLVCILMLFLNPFLAQKKNAILASKTAKNVVEALVPGKFKTSHNGQRVIYIGDVSRDHKVAKALFVADAPPGDLIDADAIENHPVAWSITSASAGYQRVFGENKDTFVIAEKGHRYQGVPGQQNFKVSDYDRYGVAIPQEENFTSMDSDALSTAALLRHSEHSLRYNTELQWRLSVPVSAVLLAVLAQLLSRVPPRVGRFQQLVPAILIYIVYANLMFVGRNWMYHGKTPEWLGFWWVHLALLLCIAFLGYRKTKG